MAVARRRVADSIDEVHILSSRRAIRFAPERYSDENPTLETEIERMTGAVKPIVGASAPVD
jgi:hypothetical protein